VSFPEIVHSFCISLLTLDTLDWYCNDMEETPMTTSTIKTTHGAVNGLNGAWECGVCTRRNQIEDRATFDQEVVCKHCGCNFDLQQWDAEAA
jgi:hypothetical protein